MRVPRILLTAPSSGSGKTLVTCGILQAFRERGLDIVSFKCGPDYIDPMFHGQVIGTRSRNLDTFFTDPERTRYLFTKNAQNCDLAVIEGVMGYYDGLGGVRTEGSTYEVARVLDAPVILIVNARGASLSLLALIRGFLEFRKDSYIRGVILNQVSPMIYGQLKPLIESELGIQVLGYVPKVPELSLESRHLGLKLPEEVEELREKLRKLASILEETLELDAIWKLAKESEPVQAEAPLLPRREERRRLRIGVAQDAAFCFTYLDNLELLEELGAELVPFSPMMDEKLPEGLQGLILSGGYPELHAEALGKNQSMRRAVKDAIEGGMPCIAECGGFLYLHRELEGMDGMRWPMAGVIDAEAYRTDRLGRFGYITLEAREDQLLGKAGMKIRGHEFHYWESSGCGEGFHAVKPTGRRSWDCVWVNDHLYAGFPHLFFYSNLDAPVEFLKKCEEYGTC